MTTRNFLKPLQHFFATRHLLKPNVTYPLYSIFVIAIHQTNNTTVVGFRNPLLLRLHPLQLLPHWPALLCPAAPKLALPQGAVRRSAERQHEPRQLFRFRQKLLDQRPQLRRRCGSQAPMGGPQRARKSSVQVPKKCCR